MDNFHEILNYLMDTENNLITVSQAEKAVPNTPGIYAIYINSIEYFPDRFDEKLKEEISQRGTKLLYVGQAVNLHKRLIQQDLQGKNRSTFFKSMAAAFGFRDKQITKNDKLTIANLIKTCILIKWCECDIWEIKLINELKPILNITHNPQKSSRLKQLRKITSQRS